MKIPICEDVCPNECVGAKKVIEEVKKAINGIYTFINIERDMYGKVTMKDVKNGLNELKIVLGIK